MDNLKWTARLFSRPYLFIATITLFIGVIISHFSANHTQTNVITLNSLQQTIPLPILQVRPKPAPIILTPQSQEPITKTIQFRSGVIHSSIEQAALSAGLPYRDAHEVMAMFAADGIANKVRPGDRLNILYHEYFVGDQKDHPGNIVAAEIVDGKNTYRMVRFVAPNHTAEFYTPNGSGTAPLFLPFPLHYRRIGSRFNYHRLDPILHKVRPHLAVDFDAPMGTPVKAISDGVVVFRKQIHGYGNALMIRYRDRYKSFYAHLERYASYIKPNTPVKKGEIVGYVGETGWATGPHLHFSIYKNGIPVNPLTVQFPHGSPVPSQYRRDFTYKTNRWFAQMNLYESVLADNRQKTALKAHVIKTVVQHHGKRTHIQRKVRHRVLHNTRPLHRLSWVKKHKNLSKQ